MILLNCKWLHVVFQRKILLEKQKCVCKTLATSFIIIIISFFQGMSKKELVALFYKTIMKPVQSACHSIRRIGKRKSACMVIISLTRIRRTFRGCILHEVVFTCGSRSTCWNCLLLNLLSQRVSKGSNSHFNT